MSGEEGERNAMKVEKEATVMSVIQLKWTNNANKRKHRNSGEWSDEIITQTILQMTVESWKSSWALFDDSQV